MPSLEDIGKSVESGTKKAFETYVDMSEGYAEYVPESFVQSHIALALKGECYVSLEERPRDLRDAKNIRGRPPKDDKRKYDIAVWWKQKEGARVTIEIKRARDKSSCNGDIEKLKRAIKYKWTERGMIVAYAIASEPKNIEKRFKAIADNIKKIGGNTVSLGKWCYKEPKKLGDEYWGVAWFEMSPKSK